MSRQGIFLQCLLLLFCTVVQSRLDIRDFGASSVENMEDLGKDFWDNLEQEQANAQALNDALIAANWTTIEEDREVYIPWNNTFHMMPIKLDYMRNVTLTIDGTVKVSKRQNNWPRYRNGGGKLKLREFWEFDEAHDLTIQGNGTVDGQGYMWWMREYIGTNPLSSRPDLVRINGATNLEVSGVKFKDSPHFHVHVEDFDGLYFHDFEIEVNRKG